MNVLLSIKPIFVKKIIKKEKQYEFRRNIFKKDIEHVVIYSTAPDKEIRCYFKKDQIIKDTPESLWNKYESKSGIEKEKFFNYFQNKDEGFAIKIKDLKILSEPINVSSIDDFVAPQSFKYISDDYLEELIRK